MASTPIVYFPLFRAMVVTSNGTALSKSTLDLQITGISEAFAQAQGVFVIGLTENVANTDIEWNLSFISGFDRLHEAAAIDINVVTFDSTMGAGARSADYTTATNFLPSTRLQVWWRNKTGISGMKTAHLSGILGVHLRQS